MSDKPAQPTPAKAPDPTPEQRPSASAKRKKPLVTHLAPPTDRRVGRTALHRGRDIDWRLGPVQVRDNGQSAGTARLRLDPLNEDRGPGVYAMTAEAVDELVRVGQARVAIHKRHMTIGEAKAAEEAEAAKRRARTEELRKSGERIAPQSKPEERRYGRDVYTVLPLRQLEGGAA